MNDLRGTPQGFDLSDEGVPLPLRTFSRNPRVQYAVAIAAVLVATYARMQLDPIVGNKNVFLPYLCGVILTALIAGPVPTLVMVFLSAAVADYLFLAPRYSFVVERSEDQVTLGVFVLIGVCSAALSWQIRRANDRALRLQLQLQKEQASRESERRFRQLADAMPQIVWAADANGRVEYYNERWSEYTGLPKHGGQSKDWIHVLHDDDVQICRETWRQAVQTGQPYQMEYRFKNRSGSGYRWHLGRAVPVRDIQGRILGWYGTCTDIDEQKRIEGKLRESERLYRAIGESIDYGVWVCDPEGRTTYTSPSLLRLVGLTQEQYAEFGWASALQPGTAAQSVAAWKECVRTRGKWDYEHRFRGVDGSEHVILSRGVPVEDDQGRILCWGGINLDITRLKNIENALQKAHDELEQRVEDRTKEIRELYERLSQEVKERRGTEARSREQAEEIETLMEIVPVPIWFARDADCLQITRNSAGYELTRTPQGTEVTVSRQNGAGSGQNGDDHVGYRTCRNGDEILTKDLPMQRAAATGQPVRNAEFDLVFNDGSVRSLYGFAAPLFNEQDRVRGCIGAFVDITEHKLTENRLRAALSDRETLLKEVHHRVKNNLAITISLLNFQIREARDRRLIETLRDAQNRVRSMAMIHERLYRTKSLAAVDLSEYVDQLTRQLIASYGVADSILPDVQVTPVELLLETAIPFGLILNELVSNACKHAYPQDQSGRLMIRVARESPENLALVVADEGVGIPDEIDPISTRSLGLRLVRDLTQQLGGTLEIIRSAGTAFHVRFPFTRGDEP